MKVINVIQDVLPTTSRKRSREGPFDDPLVVTMSIDHCMVKHILIDTGSSANIHFKNTFLQMEVSWSQVMPYIIPLVGFTGRTIYSEGKICLPVNVEHCMYGRISHCFCSISV